LQPHWGPGKYSPTRCCGRLGSGRIDASEYAAKEPAAGLDAGLVDGMAEPGMNMGFDGNAGAF